MASSGEFNLTTGDVNVCESVSVCDENVSGVKKKKRRNMSREKQRLKRQKKRAGNVDDCNELFPRV